MKIKYRIETWGYTLTDEELSILMRIVPSGEWSKEFEEYNSIEGQKYKFMNGYDLPDLTVHQLSLIKKDLTKQSIDWYTEDDHLVIVFMV